MLLIARRIAFQFCQPPFAPIRWSRAIPAPAMLMPEAAVNEDDGLVFGKNDVGTDPAEAAERS